MTRLFISLRLAVAALLALAVVGAATPSQAQAQSPDSIYIEILKAGWIVGVTGGRGTLNSGGKRYRLGVGGVSLGLTFGASKADLVGRVYNLRRPSDIAGTYVQAEAGYAVVGGRKAARLKNQNGVVLELRGRQVGLEFNLDLSGMVITMR